MGFIVAKQTYAVVLHANVPSEFLALFIEGYLREDKELKYLLCNSIEFVSSFVLAGVLKDNFSWPVHIPVSYIVAIADNSAPQVAAGFLSGTQ
jgi:hypothetical protein